MYVKFDEHYPTWLESVKILAELDCLMSLAKSSIQIGGQFLGCSGRRPCFLLAAGSLLIEGVPQSRAAALNFWNPSKANPTV